MYEVINCTSKEFLFKGERLLPNHKVHVNERPFCTEIFKCVDLGMFEIVSDHGKHLTRCYGNISIVRERGEKRTIFKIQTKN